MLSCLTHATVRMLDWLAADTLAADSGPAHQRIGRRGEEDAYFYLRKLGYVMVVRNFRSPLRRGGIDLLGWEQNVLCFIEAKTRPIHNVKPAEAAVSRKQATSARRTTREYLRHLPSVPQWHFDVVSVCHEGNSTQPRFELFKNSRPMT